MKFCIDVNDLTKFKDITLSLDLDEEHNRIGFSFIRNDGDVDHVIMSGSFKVYEEDA